jgi:hypothetical protein
VKQKEAPTLTFRSETGMKVPSINSEQWKQLLQLTIPFSTLILESAARSCTLAVINLLHQTKANNIQDGSTSPQKQQKTIVVMIGTGRKGLIAWGIARHLSNHNYNVYVCRSR